MWMDCYSLSRRSSLARRLSWELPEDYWHPLVAWKQIQVCGMIILHNTGTIVPCKQYDTHLWGLFGRAPKCTWVTLVCVVCLGSVLSGLPDLDDTGITGLVANQAEPCSTTIRK